MKAAELIPDIRAAYAALMKSETEGFGQTLFLAIELGTLLNQAKADPDVGAHGKWEKWFEEQNFGFSLRKAQRCMRYANSKDDLMAAAKTSALTHLVADHRLGICDADALLRKPKGSGSGAGKPRATKASVVPPDPPPQPDPVKIIAELDVDEMLDNVKSGWEPSKQRALLSSQLRGMDPSNLAMVLTNVWQPDAVQVLVAELDKRMKKSAPELASMPPPTLPRPRLQQPEART